ncbi:hypothetical protein RhiTH_003401 [Rhizoctonia solani]
MEPIIEDDNVANLSNIDISIADLDEFIQSQRSALGRVQDGIKALEELKIQAVVHPVVVLNGIMGGEHESLKFSNIGSELDTNIPRLDWTLFGPNDFQPVTRTLPPKAGTSRVDKMRAHISEFRQGLASAPPLPAELLDNSRDAEERDKKRRRLTSASRAPVANFSSGLRLPRFAESCNNINVQTSALAGTQPQELGPPPTPSSGASSRNSTKPPVRVFTNHVHSQSQPRVPKTADEVTQALHESPRATSPRSRNAVPSPTQPGRDSPIIEETEGSVMEALASEEQSHSTFKQNWSLAEQHTLERLLVEIPSTVKFRWVRISEAMGGTRTPRQVASRVQKYYEKMKKLGVTVNSADMGGGGRGGSKATQALDAPPSVRSRNSSTRGKPKTGPQYTKSGRRR